MNSNRKIAISAFLAVVLITGNVRAESVKQDEEKETILTGLIFSSHSENYGTWTGAGAEELFADTNIRLEFYPSGNGEKLRQYMAAGTLPDFIGFETSQVELLRNADLLLNLDDYKEQLSEIYENEDYEKAIDYCRESFGGEDCGLYLLPLEIGEEESEEFNWMPMLQWKPYEEVGCPEVKTLQAYLDVVEEMLRYKSTTPVGSRVYGFSLFGETSDCMIQEAAALCYLYGVDIGLVSPLIEMNGKTKELQTITAEDSFYRKALEFYFEANQRGLLDPDSRTQTYDGLKQKYDRGSVLFANYSWIVEDCNESEEFMSSYFAPVIASDMKIYREPGAPAGTDFYFGVSRNAVNPEKVCEFLNWLYRKDTICYLYQNSQDMEPFEVLGLSKAQAGIKETPLYYREASDEGFAEEITVETYLEENGMIQEGSSAVYMLPPDPTRIQILTQNIGETIRELSWDMIYAPDWETFENLWEQMQKESSLLGMEEVESYYQNVWTDALKKEIKYEKES